MESPDSPESPLLLIRNAEIGDSEEVYKLITILEEHDMNRDKFQEKFQRNLNNPDIHYLIAEQSGKVAGFLSLHIQNLLHHDKPAAEIQELVVDPNTRSQGTGKQLVEAATRTAIENGCEVLEVTTNKIRERTQKFYANNGLTQSHVKFTRKLP